MAAIYVDTSALIKVYVAETGHAWMNALCRPKSGNVVFASQLTAVELEVALLRKAAERTIAEAERDRSIALFRRHLRRRYTVETLTADVFSRARRLIRTEGLPHPLRTYDALHLASAQVVADTVAALGAGSLTFIAADRKLLAVARYVGLAVEDPEDYP